MWITCAMFICPRFRARPHIREAFLKKCIAITWVGLPGRSQKTVVRNELLKNNLCRNVHEPRVRTRTMKIIKPWNDGFPPQGLFRGTAGQCGVYQYVYWQ